MAGHRCSLCYRIVKLEGETKGLGQKGLLDLVHSVRSECKTSQKLKRRSHGNGGKPGRLTEQNSVSQNCVCDAQTTLRPQEYEDSRRDKQEIGVDAGQYTEQ